MVEGREESSGLVEAEADAREGSADTGEELQVCVKDIVAGETRGVGNGYK